MRKTPSEALDALDEVADAAVERDQATAALIGATHRAAEAGATITDIARLARVGRDTIMAWKLIPVTGDTVNVVEMHHRALEALGVSFNADDSLQELRQALSEAIRKEPGKRLSMEEDYVIGAATIGARLTAGTDQTTVVLEPVKFPPPQFAPGDPDWLEKARQDIITENRER